MSKADRMKEKKENRKIIAIAGTLFFHGILVLILLLFALKTPLPLPAEQGVEVNLGNSDDGAGIEQPQQIQNRKPAPTSPPKTEPGSKASKQEKILTEDNPDNPAIPDSKKKTKPKTEKPKTETKSETKPQPSEPKVNPDALYKPSSNSTSSGQNQGITGKPGDQGKINGTPQSDNYTGSGGTGGGISYDLGGRGAMSLPKPSYDSKEQGKVVVTIWVDREGKVIEAREGAKGTTISDSHLRKIAREAALKARFKSDPDAPEKQTGTITYNFIRLN